MDSSESLCRTDHFMNTLLLPTQPRHSLEHQPTPPHHDGGDPLALPGSASARH